MEALFLQILSMSFSASWLIIAVILIRLMIKNAPKGFRYVLWALVAVRLLCPVFIESDFSLVPSQNVIVNVGEAVKPMAPTTPDVLVGNGTNQNNHVQNNDVQNNDVQNQTPQENIGQNNNAQNNVTATKRTPATIMTWIWLCGIFALFIYAVVSYGLLRKTIKTSIHGEENLWVCDGIQSPFILGLIRPQIYLPSYIEEHHIPYIVAHEKEHIRCKDNWWKTLGFILLTIHWFNPLVWAAYILMCKDIELACDERVIRSMNADDKKNYSKSLLLCSNPKHFISACPVAFGEVGVKERIKKIVDYRKPSVWIIGIGIVICMIVAFGFMTNPKTESKGVAKIVLKDGPLYTEITDAETIQEIIGDINDLVMIPVFPSLPSGGWSYWIKMYDADGNYIDNLTLLGEDTIKGDYFIYKTINGTFDTEYFDWLIKNYKVDMKDHLSSMVGQRELSQEELEWFSTEFFNNDENRITNMFLTSTYVNVKNIDLANLFSSGADGYGTAPVSEDEKQLLAQKDEYTQGSLSVHGLDIAKTTKEEMEAVLEKYTGLPLAGVNQKNLHNLYFLEEYHAYYYIAGDTLMTKYAFEKGWKEDDGDVILQYTDALSGDGTEKYIVTLRPAEGSYYFVSNASLSGNKEDYEEENAISKELLEWFETEYFNQENNRIINQFLTSAYEFPAVIDLYELFYNGVGETILGGSDIPSEEEKNLILDYYRDEPFTDLIRITRKDMNAVLQKYMGISLEETSKVCLEKMYYLEKYDVYYMMHGDTNYNRYVFESGTKNEDGSITLHYHAMDDTQIYYVTLVEKDGIYQFRANYKIYTE